MTVSWKSWPELFCVCLSLCATGVVSQVFQLEPLNSTVLQGSDVAFNATVEGEWRVMTWSVGELLVLSATVTPTGLNIISSKPQFSARACSSGNASCVEFTIHNVTRMESGNVNCYVLGLFGTKTAQLHVQESGTINIMGGNVTVVQDQQVEFQCVTSAWSPTPTVSWTRNGEVVNSSLYNTTSIDDGGSFNTTSVLKFQAVSDTTLECWATVPALKNPKSSSVLVEVVPSPPDWTVLIAVVASIGGFALLVLLIIGIIFCYKRRKEKQPNYQDEMSRRVRTQSEISGVNAEGPRQGRMNAGYLPDDQKSVPELTDGGFSQANDFNCYEMPDVVNSNQAGNSYKTAYNTVDESGFRKHRHVTIV